MHVSVAIVGYRNAEDISRCLGALEASAYRDFEVVVCENGGKPAYDLLLGAIPAELAGGQKVRTILAEGNLGYAGGVNRCLQASPDADAWWILNPDTLPDPQALQALSDRLAKGDCDLVAGVMHYADDTVESYGGRWRPWLARAISIGHGRGIDEPIDEDRVARQITYVPGGSMLVSRRFVDLVGLMREDYFLYGEEVDWCERGLRRGTRIGFAPNARVLHNQGSTTGSAGAIKDRPKLPIYLDERNKILIIRDHFPFRLLVTAPLALALALLRYGRKGAWRQAGFAIAGWAAGVANQRGVPRWLQGEGLNAP